MGGGSKNFGNPCGRGVKNVAIHGGGGGVSGLFLE